MSNRTKRAPAGTNRMEEAKQAPPNDPVDASPPKPLSNLNPQEKQEYEHSVIAEITKLVEDRGCTMNAHPVYQRSATGAWETICVLEVSLKPHVVIERR